MRLSIVIAILALIFFGFPLLGGVGLPASFAAEELGRFIADLLAYWKTFFTSIAL